MTALEQQFWRDLTRAGRNHSHGALVQAFFEFNRQGRINKRDVPACVQRAADLERHLRPRVDTRPVGRTAVRRARSGDAEAKLRAEVMLAMLQPSVDALRESLFGMAGAAPFADLRSSAAWVRNTSLQERAGHKPDRDSVARLRSAAWEAAEALNAADPEYHHGLVSNTIPGVIYTEQEGGPLFPAWGLKNGPLYQLAQATRRWEAQTGFLANELVAYVLCGRKPAPPRIHIELATDVGQSALHRESGRNVLRLEMETSDVTAEQFRELYRQICGLFKLRRTKAITAQDRRLLMAVEAEGGLPVRRESLPFWRAVQKRLPGYKEKTPQAVREAYRRLEKRRRKLSN